MKSPATQWRKGSSLYPCLSCWSCSTPARDAIDVPQPVFNRQLGPWSEWVQSVSSVGFLGNGVVSPPIFCRHPVLQSSFCQGSSCSTVYGCGNYIKENFLFPPSFYPVPCHCWGMKQTPGDVCQAGSGPRGSIGYWWRWTSGFT